MKQIETLIEDIYEVLDKGVGGDDYGVFGQEMAGLLSRRLEIDEAERVGKLRLSNIGTPCARQLWYRVNTPNNGEPLLPHTRLKFLYGDILELLLLQLVRSAGHTVEGEQDEVQVNGVVGHRDCVIDGILVDVKSASDYSFKKFEGGLASEDDSFGYLTQLASYLLAAKLTKDPLIKEYNRAAFFVINKVTGKLCLDVHEFTDEQLQDAYDLVTHRQVICDESAPLPDRGFEPVPDGKSGNERLGVNCSYCAFKNTCWPELRTFVYANGPKFLTTVERTPDVPEAK